MAAKKSKPEPGPDELVRASAGAYRTGDGRFEVQKAGQGWFLVDTEQADELGQQLLKGPFGTLDEVRAAIPGARQVKPLLARLSRKPAAAKRAAQAPPRPAPKSWIDELPRAEATEVRGLIRVLEAEGVDKAEALVRRARDSDEPLIARALVEARLRAVIAESPQDAREQVHKAVRRAAEILTEEGAVTARPLPRWELVEAPRDPTAAPHPLKIRP